MVEHRRNSRGSRCFVLGCLLGALCACLPTAGAAEPPSRDPGWVELDLGLPAQEIFRDWPPAALLARPYWHAWGWPAFHQASLFRRPVLFVLTVGWSRDAQKMRETLSRPDLLTIANQGYISVLVNADLRPDIAERYRTGTWPVVAFLLPDGNPMLHQVQLRDPDVSTPVTAGAVDAGSMEFLLYEGTKYWNKWTDALIELGGEWARREAPRSQPPATVDEKASDRLAGWMRENVDSVHGGFGAAVKFVIPGFLEYTLLRAARGAPELEGHGRLSWEKLVQGPLYDPVEGGAHRLASAIPGGGVEYEKMLVANAAVIRELVLALRAGESPLLRQALEGSVGFVRRTLERPEGGFYLAQVADPTSEDGGGYWRAADREALEPPPIDPLVLSGPNALAGAALLRAGALLGNSDWGRAGAAALELVLERAYRRGRGVDHAIEPYRGDRIYLVTQADVAFGLIDAYESTGREAYLKAARDIAEAAWLNLRDPVSGLLLDHLGPPRPLGLLANPRWPLRSNARMARVLLRLSLHVPGEPYRERALALLAGQAGDLSIYGVQATESALAIEEAIREPLRIRIRGGDSSAAVRLREAALGSPWPWTVVLSSGEADDSRAAAVLEWGEASRTVRKPGELHEAILALTARGEP